MLNPLVHHKPVSMGSQWVIYIAREHSMDISMGIAHRESI